MKGVHSHRILFGFLYHPFFITYDNPHAWGKIYHDNITPRYPKTSIVITASKIIGV
jgi:hypothetical protein